MPRVMEVKMSKKQLGCGEQSSELRNGLWACKMLFTLLDSMIMKGFHEGIY